MLLNLVLVLGLLAVVSSKSTFAPHEYDYYGWEENVTCGVNEEFRPDGECPPTCHLPKPYGCIAPAPTWKCFCKSSYIRTNADGTGKCIKPKHCTLYKCHSE